MMAARGVAAMVNGHLAATRDGSAMSVWQERDEMEVLFTLLAHR